MLSLVLQKISNNISALKLHTVYLLAKPCSSIWIIATIFKRKRDGMHPFI